MLDLQKPALINLTFRKFNIKEIKSNNFNKFQFLHIKPTGIWLIRFRLVFKIDILFPHIAMYIIPKI